MNNIEIHNEAPEKHHAKRSNIAWWVFAAIALFYLLTEHQAHFLGALPYLLLLACPLMHIFMHHGHGHQGHDGGDKK
ncbi:DUF2933 domain-containing protein [Ferribacterium limneticum]|uniref:DUF2933 domain-containing protein n=1 Tax=Ferribacterium limneticum TaxID=76259 RepID=UPI001CF864BD|nr:DUF2933 domain-containing protein [Ferribacterium limneticum]UCV22336.1 DUF2933 domain-containing protein [Ferribacterium limneticum]